MSCRAILLQPIKRKHVGENVLSFDMLCQVVQAVGHPEAPIPRRADSGPSESQIRGADKGHACCSAQGDSHVFCRPQLQPGRLVGNSLPESAQYFTLLKPWEPAQENVASRIALPVVHLCLVNFAVIV